MFLLRSKKHETVFKKTPYEQAALIKRLNYEEERKYREQLVQLDEECMARNRYSNILPYEANRVHLEHWGLDCDYINASYIQFDGQNAFIATQGPTMATVELFWMMVWQSVREKGIIVMLTRLEEKGRLKCDEYWPSKPMETLKMKSLSVKLMRTYFIDDMNRHVVHEFLLQCGGKKKIVHHIYYFAWPDFSAPEMDSFLNILQFVRELLQLPAFKGSPVIVHCSAGCGRTGTFMALFRILNLLEKNHFELASDPIPEIVSELRSQRMQSVQSLQQLEFLYYVSAKVSVHHRLPRVVITTRGTHGDDFSDDIKNVSSQSVSLIKRKP
ncbi:protein-tyrosine phosphatase Pyp3 [Schizosaccharomyces japonicus yFS275]|uniref:Protein-tyrosine phosphatase Pyp3 n=1 Tax=Schizosaccharomyces japonicus (strain yFS275 / FY16936) TaxID=402676 RepID=B6JV14_SCHJY|nr:protein-tyrosine phosphatase Pyp3 [Schizosaccharomyces japonicus yFS275]EEB05215.1 protein-tyrosine phosphatase Pyp3 [Schizosaccharomyces japonicus yFS275]